MSDFLHILDGDSAVSQLAEARLPGVFLPWRDLLHEGPVPAGLSLEATSQVRASYLAETYGLDSAVLAASFRERDVCLRGYRNFDQVVLWSSRDLHDHCHLLQLLAFFAEEKEANLALVFNPDPFSSLGSKRLAELFASRQAATPDQLRFGCRAWTAFCAADPRSLLELSQEPVPHLPFFRELNQRLFEEFPDFHTGLSRSQRQALETVSAGPLGAAESFVRMVAFQDPAFMGDLSYWQVLDELATSPMPLLARMDGKPWVAFSQAEEQVYRQQRMVLTEAGQRVRAGRLDWTSKHQLNRWIGGVHLTVHSKFTAPLL